jgi:ribonuclease HI
MDIVKELHRLLKRHSVRSMWTKGHAGLRENELVDTYAQRASDNPKEYLKSRYEILTK